MVWACTVSGWVVGQVVLLLPDMLGVLLATLSMGGVSYIEALIESTPCEMGGERGAEVTTSWLLFKLKLIGSLGSMGPFRS